jgi:AcrR family transcriptional regulator
LRKTNPVKHQEKRLAILQAAIRCFVRDGFHRASISDICAEAKISPGHLYHYFENKEAIVGGMAELGMDQAISSFVQIMDTADAAQSLVQAMLAGGEASDTTSRVLMMEIMAETGRSPVIAKIVSEHLQRLRGLIADFLRRGQERGQIDSSLDPDLSAHVLISVTNGGKAFIGLDPGLDQDLCKAQLGIMITGFLKPKSES